MACATAAIDIPVEPDTVWELIGGFASLPDWLPYITKSELGEGGRIRRLTTSDGDTIVERLTRFDDSARSYSYTFVQAPFPVTDYFATLRVSPAPGGSGSRVDWTGQFTPDGVGDEEARQLFLGIYHDGLAALTAHYKSDNE
jgi:hypothetical protein